MKCFLTGASGFVGGNLAVELVRRGHRVIALCRPGNSDQNSRLPGVEWVPGDLVDGPLLTRAMKGCDWCFHVAASYHLWLPDYRPMFAANVEGTRTVIESAERAGCARIVHTSTVGCVGLPKPAGGEVAPTNEMTPVSGAQMKNPYKRSKWEAEQIALERARAGAPVVIVNPSAPVGPRDVKPTPTGQIIVDFLHRRLPAYLETGLNWVHVRDVAAGHILAAEKGRVGERYILGNATGNWTMRETLAALEDLSGVPAPRIRVPYGVALAAAWTAEGISLLTRKPPKAPLAGVRMAKYKMFFDPSKAVRELGLPQTAPKQAFLEAIEWFRTNGY